ncbi:hypothetical protein FHS70_001151 [Flammeovirga yaeyamensis]|nr:hypothetical protein [Flammeovirga yaeyamensis]
MDNSSLAKPIVNITFPIIKYAIDNKKPEVIPNTLPFQYIPIVIACIRTLNPLKMILFLSHQFIDSNAFSFLFVSNL